MKVMVNRDVRACAWIGIALLCGCGSGDDAAPATQPTPTQPAPTQPAPTAERPVVLEIGGETVAFASVQLEVAGDEDALNLQLLGSDGATPPRTSFYFRLSIDAELPAELPGKVWQFKRSAGEDVDGAAGIFLEGEAIRFLPQDMSIELGGKYPNLTVTIRGKLLRDGDEKKPVMVSGKFAVRATETPR